MPAIPCYIHGVGREVFRVGSWSLAVHLLITFWLYGRGGAGDVPVISPWREKMEKRGKHGRGTELTRGWAKETLNLARIIPESLPDQRRLQAWRKRDWFESDSGGTGRIPGETFGLFLLIGIPFGRIE